MKKSFFTIMLVLGFLSLPIFYGVVSQLHIDTAFAAEPAGDDQQNDIPRGDDPNNNNPRGECSGATCLTNPLKTTSVTGFLLAVIEVLLIFATPVIVIYIMYAGFQFVMSRGAPGEIEHARQALLYAIIGGIIIVGAQVIINIIQTTINSLR